MLLAVVFWITTPIPIEGAEFIVLDEVLGHRTRINAVSGDGSMVVGASWATGQRIAMTWTRDGGIVELPGG
jgi:hypothetical protein